jgi:hypothetical protein
MLDNPGLGFRHPMYKDWRKLSYADAGIGHGSWGSFDRRGRAIKRDNFLTSIACGFLPAILLYAAFPAPSLNLLFSFIAGFLWLTYSSTPIIVPPAPSGTSLARKHPRTSHDGRSPQ